MLFSTNLSIQNVRKLKYFQFTTSFKCFYINYRFFILNYLPGNLESAVNFLIHLNFCYVMIDPRNVILNPTTTTTSPSPALLALSWEPLSSLPLRTAVAPHSSPCFHPCPSTIYFNTAVRAVLLKYKPKHFCFLHKSHPWLLLIHLQYN